jgi:hypothetical protein
MMDKRAIARIKKLLALYRKIDNCSEQTPWCKDPSYSNGDHYDGHHDAKLKIMRELYKIFEI